MYDKIKNIYEEGGNIEETLSGDAQHIPLPSVGGNTGDKSGDGDKRKSGGGNDDDNNGQDENGSTRRPERRPYDKKEETWMV